MKRRDFIGSLAAIFGGVVGSRCSVGEKIQDSSQSSSGSCSIAEDEDDLETSESSTSCRLYFDDKIISTPLVQGELHSLISKRKF